MVRSSVGVISVNIVCYKLISVSLVYFSLSLVVQTELFKCALYIINSLYSIKSHPQPHSFLTFIIALDIAPTDAY